MNDYQLLIVDYFNQQRFENNLENLKQKEVIIIAWSMGTLRAMKLLTKFNVKKLILLSPTLNFLENQKKIVVKKIIRDLKRDKLKLLKKFSRLLFYSSKDYQLYLKDYQNQFQNLEQAYLIRGLEFLLKTNLTEVNLIKNVAPLVIVGKKDQIIKNSSSRKALTKFSDYSFFELKNKGHNLLFSACS